MQGDGRCIHDATLEGGSLAPSEAEFAVPVGVARIFADESASEAAETCPVFLESVDS